MFTLSDFCHTTYPSAFAGVLVMRDSANPPLHEGLEEQKDALTIHLRAQYSRLDRLTIASHPILQVYRTYYKHFDKTYHVQLQLESVVFKGKPIPSVAALVEVMFMAELKNFLLTAVHDLDKVEFPLTLDVSKGTEIFTMLNGRDQQCKTGDLFITDQKGVISAILYGPDQRTRITERTKNVVFTAYAVPGIEKESVMQHMRDIRDLVWMITPRAQVETLGIFGET
jgi:DNA/RNA-binding domain of Phe-tRNA-synthetase-like protein